MPDRGSRWLAAVVAAMLVAQPLALAGDPAAGGAPGGSAGGREQISRQLIEIGRTPESARNAAYRLTARDLEVLLANPEMMQAAGGAQTDMAIGMLLIVALIVALAVAGGSVIIVST